MNGWLETIYRSKRQALFGLALSITRRPASAEDAVHDAVLRLARKPNPPEGDAAAYVFRAVRNAALDQLRQGKRGINGKTLGQSNAPSNGQPAPDVWLFADPGPCPAQQTEQSDERRRLMHEVQQLPESQREVIVMKVFGGLTFQQIADAGDAPLSTVASRYQRGLARLKQQMENRYEPASA
ncbi:sigma-70 family RNA polymerase sigma factor [Phycisphaeraceae bacterium D3-23]